MEAAGGAAAALGPPHAAQDGACSFADDGAQCAAAPGLAAATPREPPAPLPRRGYSEQAAALTWTPPPRDVDTSDRVGVPASLFAVLAALLALFVTLLLLRLRRAAAEEEEAAGAFTSPPPSSAPRAAAATSTATGASATPRSSPGDAVRKRLSFRSASLGAASDAAADDVDVDVASLGAALGAAAGAALAPALRLRAAEEAALAEAAPQSSAVDEEDAAPASAPQPLASRVAAAAPALARHTGAVLAQHGLLPPPRGVEDATSDAGAVEPAVPSSPPPSDATLGAADGRRFVAAFCTAFEANALSVEAELASPLVQLALTPLTPGVSATSLGGLEGATVAQLAAVASGRASTPMPAEQLAAINTLAAVHSNVIAEAALDARVAQLEEMTRTNELREHKYAAAEAAAEVAVLRSAAADALLAALLLAAVTLGRTGWRTARALPHAVRDCAVDAGWHRGVFAALSRPSALWDGVNCALAATAQACGAGAALVLTSLALARWAAGPGPGAAAAVAGSARVTGLLLLSLLVCFGGGRAAAALGGSGAVWGVAWAPLLFAHVVLHAGYAPTVARIAAAAPHTQRVAAWVVVAVAWPLAASTLAFADIWSGRRRRGYAY